MKINSAENESHEQINFRNLVIFVIGINLPLKTNDLLCLKYRDVFNENDQPKAIELRLGRFHKDEILLIPLRNIVIKVLLAYTHHYGLTYANNANDDLFQSRKHQPLSQRALWNILNDTVLAAGIEKNIGAESLRKTYGLNVFEQSDDKFKAILFLGELWGQVRESKIIQYLNLTDGEIDFEYYFSEFYALGNVDFSKIKCLQQRTDSILSNHKTISSTNQIRLQPRQPKKEGKTNRLWTKEKKLEIVLKYLNLHISQKDSAEEYGVDKANISRWVNDYKNYGASIFEDKRFKYN